MKHLTALLSCLLLCACAPEKPAIEAPMKTTWTMIVPKEYRGHAEPPLGCEIVEQVQPNGTFYSAKVGNYDLAPYALYDTRQGAIDCAWLCYRPEAKP